MITETTANPFTGTVKVDIVNGEENYPPCQITAWLDAGIVIEWDGWDVEGGERVGRFHARVFVPFHRIDAISDRS